VTPPKGQRPREIEDQDKCESLEDTLRGLDRAITERLRGKAEPQE